MPPLTRRRFLRTTSLAAVALSLPRPTIAAASRRRRPVILDTDIGTDIDDTWALAYLLRCPELDLKLVLTDTGDTRYRATIAAKLLQRAGRTDVPVGLGRNFGPMADKYRNLSPWIADYALKDYPGTVHEDGIGAMIRVVMDSPEPVTVIAIGAVPNLALALRREPRLAARCRFVGMDGSFDVGYDGRPPPSAEANVAGNPAALRATLAAPWQDKLITPLDTCGSVTLTGERYHALWCATDDPLLRAVIESYCIFAPRVSWMRCDFFATRSTTLFDCVAVYLAHDEALVDVEPVRFRITDDGHTVRDPGGLAARVALRWKNRDAFERQLTERLLHPL